MNGAHDGWNKQEILKEMLPILIAHGVTYFQWEGLTISFSAKTSAAPEPRPVEAEASPVVPVVKK